MFCAVDLRGGKDEAMGAPAADGQKAMLRAGGTKAIVGTLCEGVMVSDMCVYPGMCLPTHLLHHMQGGRLPTITTGSQCPQRLSIVIFHCNNNQGHP